MDTNEFRKYITDNEITVFEIGCFDAAYVEINSARDLRRLFASLDELHIDIFVEGKKLPITIDPGVLVDKSFDRVFLAMNALRTRMLTIIEPIEQIPEALKNPIYALATELTVARIYLESAKFWDTLSDAATPKTIALTLRKARQIISQVSEGIDDLPSLLERELSPEAEVQPSDQRRGMGMPFLIDLTHQPLFKYGELKL